MDDRYFMNMALDLAARGAGFTAPNPMVGAVVVRDGSVVGRGYHQAVGMAHAEVNALADAGNRARGATLYVTLEPCNHTGRTPPCTRAVLEAGIRQVVMAMEDPNPEVAGGGAAFLRAGGVPVRSGVCEARARRLNAAFIKHATTGRPLVVLKCAATLDGRIATRTGDARWVTGPEARQYVHRLRHRLDAIMVGIGTVLQDDPSLTVRLEDLAGRDPLRIVLDTHLRIPVTARLLHLDSNARTLIICAEDAPARRRERLVAPGVEVLAVPVTGNGRIDLRELTARLGARGIASVLLEGGSRVIASALDADIVDRAVFFYAPKILGGDDGVPVCSGPGPARMDQARQLDDVRVRRFGPDVMIEGALR